MRKIPAKMFNSEWFCSRWSFTMSTRCDNNRAKMNFTGIFQSQSVIARGGRYKFINHMLAFSSQPYKEWYGVDKIMHDESKLFVIFTDPMTAAQKRMTMKRYQARREKANTLLEIYLKNSILYKCLEESGIAKPISQRRAMSQVALMWKFNRGEISIFESVTASELSE